MSTELRIGIFEGKKAEYNIDILEALFTRGPLTSWEIAKQICKTRGSTETTAEKFYGSQKVYSVIMRKGGRLESLNKKDYIMLKDGKWELCFPKGDAILIKKPKLIAQIHPYHLKKEAINIGGRRFRKFKAPFGLQVQVDIKKLQATVSNFMNSLNVRQLHVVMAEAMSRLAQEGIDLDRINNKDLAFLVLSKVEPRHVSD